MQNPIKTARVAVLDTATIAVISIIIFILEIVGVEVDLILNPWLKTATDVQWWNVFTTIHFLTLTFINNLGLFLVYAIIFAVLLSIIVTFTYRKTILKGS